MTNRTFQIIIACITAVFAAMTLTIWSALPKGSKAIAKERFFGSYKTIGRKIVHSYQAVKRTITGTFSRLMHTERAEPAL